MSRNARTFWLVFILSVLIDQVTKFAVYWYIPPGHSGGITVIPGFLDIVHAQNPGAAFSILRDFEYRHYVFLGFTVIAAWIVSREYKKLGGGDRWTAFALGLILSGAVGNAIDRLHKRTVTDFVRVYIDADGPKKWLIETFGTNEYPTWNVADAALLIGVILFLLVSPREDAPPAPANAS